MSPQAHPRRPIVGSRPGRVRRGRGSDFAEATSDKGGTGVPPHATAHPTRKKPPSGGRLLRFGLFGLSDLTVL